MNSFATRLVDPVIGADLFRYAAGNRNGGMRGRVSATGRERTIEVIKVSCAEPAKQALRTVLTV